jgi:hypothetical protein
MPGQGIRYTKQILAFDRYRGRCGGEPIEATATDGRSTNQAGSWIEYDTCSPTIIRKEHDEKQLGSSSQEAVT